MFRPVKFLSVSANLATKNRNCASFVQQRKKLKGSYDAIIIGGGHNGLVAAAYLAKDGLEACVLERRHVVGGAAVTEEIVEGFKFSRASYVLSLLRPQIMRDLELRKHGLRVFLRDPNSYTPMLEPDGDGRHKSLTLGRDLKETQKSIAQFSARDASAFPVYEECLQRMVDALQPLLDNEPLDLNSPWRLTNASNLNALLKTTRSLKTRGFRDLLDFMTSPASKILDRWFESEPLKATLATDAVIGAMTSPENAGSGYVLLHHVMGELEGVKGAWGYVEGGMGALSSAIGRSAVAAGAEVFVDVPVSKTLVDVEGRARGVRLTDGTEIEAKTVLSNATPKVTFLDLMDGTELPGEFLDQIRGIDYTSPVTKINVALDRLPNFTADPNKTSGVTMPHHRATIHLNCENSALIHEAYMDAANGRPSRKPMIELVLPTSLDESLAPKGCHVGLLFTQYTPYSRADGRVWDDAARAEYAETIFACVETYAPGFRSSVVGYECLTPPDLESEFGLTGGNIFHGALGLDQLYCQRPVKCQTGVTTPVEGLFLCGSGAHPGGGVMGAAGALGAAAASRYLKGGKGERKKVVQG